MISSLLLHAIICNYDFSGAMILHSDV